MKRLDPEQILGLGTVEDLPCDPNAPIKKHARVKKIKGRPDDIYKIGDTGVTIGAFMNKGKWCYYVQFDRKTVAVSRLGEYPMVVGIMGFKIEEIK
jgi:hypothetical protein